MDKILQLKARDALNFIRNHPAFAYNSGDSLGSGLWFMMAPCCKRGHSEQCRDFGVTIYQDNPRWNEFQDLLDKELWDTTDFKSIDVPYERMYGEPWEYDHMEYWYELTFFIFDGNPYNFDEQYDISKWGRYSGTEGGANSFEEMIIKVADDVKEIFGDFNDQSFYTPAEKEYQEKNESWSSSPCEDPKLRQIIFNDQYVHVYEGLRNLRWLEWFITTDYAKKNWEHNIDEWQSKTNKAKVDEPDWRKEALKPYGKQ